MVAVSFSRGSSRNRGWTYVSCIGRQILCHWATWEAHRWADRLLKHSLCLQPPLDHQRVHPLSPVHPWAVTGSSHQEARISLQTTSPTREKKSFLARKLQSYSLQAEPTEAGRSPLGRQAWSAVLTGCLPQRATSPRSRNVTNLPRRQKYKQQFRQNEMTEECVSDEGTRLNSRRRTKWCRHKQPTWERSRVMTVSPSVQALSHVWLVVTPRTATRQASLSVTNSQSLLKLMSAESVMPSSHLILCRPLLLLPSIFPSIRVFPNEWVLRIRGPKYWSFSNDCKDDQGTQEENGSTEWKVSSFKQRIRKHKELNRIKEYNNWNEKNTLVGTNSRLNEAEEQIRELEDRVVEITAAEEKKGWKEMRTV